MSKRRFARFLTKHATIPERLLWNCLQNKRLDGIQFNFQQPVHGWIADFLAPELKLIIEVDGPDHSAKLHAAKDTRRDTILAHHGFSTLRVLNSEVLHELPAVLDTIRKVAKSCS